ncbi:MAG: hypothetical protein R8L07_21010 [Alphaproteobacteria bacterium]|nr:hypothetical protein [Alphaproteobacteria bacterium]
MQTPIVPTTGPTTGGGTTTLPSGTATLPSLPPSLATALKNGGSITAQVTGKPAAGQLTLSVPGGQSVTVQTPLPLPVGTTLAVALQATGSPTTLFLQPQSTGQAATQTAVPQGAGTSQGAATSPQPAVVTTLTQGSVFSATVTGAPTNGAAGQAAASGGSAPSASAPQQAGPTTTQPASNPANAPQATARTPAALPPGSAVQLRLLGFAPQGQPLSASGAQGAFTATVTGQTAGGTVAAQSQIGSLSIQLPSTPPAGTQLLLSTVGAPRLPAAGSGSADMGTARFQALQDAVNLLRSGDPAAAQRLTQSLIPQPNAQLGLAAAFLIGAMRQGGLDKWLGGDNIRALSESGAKKSGLLSRLEGDLSQTGQARDSAGQDWRVTTLPLLNDSQLEQIRLYTRPRRDNDEDGENGGSRPESKRFVVEADFSRLGPIQFDGLAKERQIDLVVRTKKPFDAAERDEIRGLFADTVSALGLGGRIDFSVVPAFDLFPEIDEPKPGGFTV